MSFSNPEFMPNPLADLMGLVDHLRKLQDEQAALDLALAEKTKELNALLLVNIPAAMDNLGLTELTLNNGTVLSVKEDTFAKITKTKEAEAFLWLKDHGAGALIKQVLMIEGEDRVLAAMEMCAARGVPFNVSEAIHTGTLKKFVRETLDAGENIPHDLFGIYIQKRAERK